MKASIHGTLQLMLALAASLGPIGQSFANAQSGGVGTGGGMFMPGTKVTVEQVERTLSKATPFLRAHLQFLELVLPSLKGQEYESIAAKMFGGKTTALEILDQVKIRMVADGPCYDSAHQPRNASVGSENAKRGFCISAKDASEQLTSENLFPQLVAISIHEIGHLAGLDEPEAQTLQRFTLQYASNMGQGLLAAMQSRLSEQLKEVRRALADLEAAKQDGSTCAAIEHLSSFSAYLTASHSQQSDLGVLLIRAHTWMEGVSLNLRARMAFHFCQRTGMVTHRVVLPNLMKSESRVNEGRSMTVVGNGDRAGLKIAVAEMRASLKRVEDAVEQDRLRSGSELVSSSRSVVPPGCFAQGVFKCLEFPGLAEGQRYSILKALEIPLEGGLYFVEGKQVSSESLPAMKGASYCRLSLATDQDRRPWLPDSLKRPDGSAAIPANFGTYTLSELSWYIPTGFLSLNIAAGQRLMLVFSCGKIRNGMMTSIAGDTSLDSLLKAFKGILRKEAK